MTSDGSTGIDLSYLGELFFTISFLHRRNHSSDSARGSPSQIFTSLQSITSSVERTREKVVRLLEWVQLVSPQQAEDEEKVGGLARAERVEKGRVDRRLLYRQDR